MLISSRAIDAVAEILVPADFFRQSHAVVFSCVLDVYGRGDPVDALTICDELDRIGKLDAAGGRLRMNELAAVVPSTSNVGRYARVVRDAATRRRIDRLGREFVRLAEERDGLDEAGLIDRVQEEAFGLSRDRARADFSLPADLVHGRVSMLSELQGRGGVVGLPTGLTDLDRVTSGLLPGNLVVLGARPAMGKTSIALGILLRASLRAGLPTALFSLEMSRDEVIDRLLAMDAHVDLLELRSGRLDLAGWGRVHDSAARIEKAPLHIDDASAPSVVEIRSRARQLQARNPGLALVVVDYVQLVAQDAENRVQEVSKISRALKVLARELSVPVLALSQLNRAVEQRHDKRPMLSDLRDSGSIEQDADVVVFVYRDEAYYEDSDQVGIAELNVAKQRNGPTKVVRVYFKKQYATFSDLASDR